MQQNRSLGVIHSNVRRNGNLCQKMVYKVAAPLCLRLIVPLERCGSTYSALALLAVGWPSLSREVPVATLIEAGCSNPSVSEAVWATRRVQGRWSRRPPEPTAPGLDLMAVAGRLRSADNFATLATAVNAALSPSWALSHNFVSNCAIWKYMS